MSKMVVTAAEANRSFSKILRDVRDGAHVVITSHGKPVADLVPHDQGSEDAEAAKREKQAKWLQFLKERETMEPQVIGPWTRDELYERD